MPAIDFETVRAELSGVLSLVRAGIANAVHDIADGGLAVALAEMAVGLEGQARLGARLARQFEVDQFLQHRVAVELLQGVADAPRRFQETHQVLQGSRLGELGLNTTEELFEQLGLGERLAPLTARYLLERDDEEDRKKDIASLVIAGTEGMVVSYAKCCYPLPGDDVMGYLTAGRGVVIHRNTCGNLSNFRKQPEKWLSVSWEKEIEREFSSQIHVETVNKPGVLAEVAATIADCGSNIEQVSVREGDEDASVMTFLLQVRDRQHLAAVLRSIRKMPSVMKVTRDCA